MTIRLRYDLIGAGWADCIVEANGQNATVSASYLSDALDDLCRATVDVLTGRPQSEAVFEEEPGGGIDGSSIASAKMIFGFA